MTWDQATAPPDARSDMFLKFRAMTGYPIRVIINEAGAAGTPLKLPGILERVVVTGAIIDLESPMPGLPAGTPVQLEILAKLALVRCETVISSVDATRRLYVDLPESMDTLQRRQHPRADVQLQSDLAVDPNEPSIPVQVINLSLGGAAYSTPVPLAVGSMAYVQLTALGLAPAEIPVKVMRCTSVGPDLWVVGVAFAALNPAQEAKIAQYVNTVLSDG
ncbi:MAG: PilZ domain [Firmicutes bacterium]|nr:PilZ domain [Bacillota bacterium]